jgi:hypothetical protein
LRRTGFRRAVVRLRAVALRRVGFLRLVAGFRRRALGILFPFGFRRFGLPVFLPLRTGLIM